MFLNTKNFKKLGGESFMNLCDLRPAVGSKRIAKRIGRGIGSGQGKTSGKGHKGQNARSGGGVRPGFEGGQMPLQRRVPKRGFNNIFRKEKAIVNLTLLNRFEDNSTVDTETLIKSGIIKKAPYGVKILALGEITKKLTVKAQAFSKEALLKIEKIGGKAEVV